MKKMLIAATLISLTSMANAGIADDRGFYIEDNGKGLYVQGDIGFSQIHIDELGSESTPVQRLAVGYDFGKFRLDVDYTRYTAFKEKECSNDSCLDASLKFSGVGVNAIYNFNTEEDLQPYLGIRVSNNEGKLSASAKNGNSSAYASGYDSSLGVGALLGLEYRTTRHLFIGGKISYDKLFSNANQFGASVTTRYKF
ncbi:opacity family porin [Phocoenobacter uteri]|nr:opacity family porin [Phocoenobacter uteri]MDG6882071.1 hypothetical protein [Phocoenobacter uteri]